MNNTKSLEEINLIFRDVLDLPDLVINNATTSDDIDEWDSLTHIQLVVAIEKHFKMKFTSAEIANWKNVGEMILCIDNKRNAKAEPKQSGAGEPKAFVKSSLEVLSNDELPSYRRNFISQMQHIAYGQNCFVGEGATLTNVKMGDRVWINKHATVFSSHDKITFGSDCYVGPYVWIEGHAGIEIGNSVHIAGPGTNLHTHSGMKMALNGEHLGNPSYKPVLEKSHYFRVPIRIGNNVWIGPNCSISPGVVINDFVVIMPNTYVRSGVIESYSVVHGDGVVEKNADFVKGILDNQHQK